MCLPCGGGGGGEGAAAPTLVEQIFQGKQRDYVTCGSCGRTSHTDDFFQDLKLEVPPEGAAPPGGTDVAAALRELLKPEEMRGAEQYACDRCGRKCDATRGVKLRSLPPVLTLQLKRFRFDRKTLARHKVNTTVAFPLTLDMRPFITLDDDDADADAAPISYEYELYAVLVHTGGASFGHYYALIKDLHADEWHEFNDATVRPIKETELLRAHGDPKAGTFGGTSAYMLLYRRRDGAAARPHTPPPAAAVADAAAAPAAPPPPETPPSASLARDTKRLRVSSPPPAPPPAYDNADAPTTTPWTSGGPRSRGPRPTGRRRRGRRRAPGHGTASLGMDDDDESREEADAMAMISQFNLQNPLPGDAGDDLRPSSRKDEDDEDPNPYGRMGF